MNQKDNRTGCPAWVGILSLFIAIAFFPVALAWVAYNSRLKICHQCNQFRVRGNRIGANFICRKCGKTHNV